MNPSPFCLHCGASSTSRLRRLNAPVLADGPAVSVDRELIEQRASAVERYQFIGWITGDHFDSCWISRAIDHDGNTVALLPSGKIDWRGGFRHPATEAALERAIRLGFAQLLSVREVPAASIAAAA